ncbi:hypothetical protein GE21DRAFT_3852 [Neurospora crassa]|uniref:Peptidase C14 caspase domain-containing protein n=1 Tax=Neurospora crassa (strain ATCC 24698 / 74-OR23-1A / CBS 708.71 / DSM 1257 / FGSC 987) TaxID=367110 RepID=Q7S0N9_NEUCR|nr:hypothetical protein NCU10001 [Neurospora crassa OR74A]EAA28880.3 hypothetical protein NCU10001 [Neurospora crassa OR74A]KHE84326.1 hypothetical protein GE21DRAFT_3852 [Neurospora crassa]|eukprot:XP_958116.3 hypothetical protein NCU10001 [Neurospora crassa OR74A]
MRRSERPRRIDDSHRYKSYHSGVGDHDFPPGPATAPLGSPRETRSHVGRLERDRGDLDRDREQRPKPRLVGSSSTISSHYPSSSSSRRRQDSNFEHVPRHARTRSLSVPRSFSPPPSDDETSAQDSDEERRRLRARHTPKTKTREHYPSGSHHRPSLQYYNDRASLSGSRLAGWPNASSRPPSRSPDPVRPKRMDRELRRDLFDRASFHQLGDDRDSLFSTPSEPNLRARLNMGVDPGLGSPRKPSALSRSGTGTFEYEGRQGGLGLRKPGTSSRAPSVAPSYCHAAPENPQYAQVRVLILTWAFHDLKVSDSDAHPYMFGPGSEFVSLEEETRRLRDTFESYGYTVDDWLIPMRDPLKAVLTKLAQFSKWANDETLLIVYYHGHGSLDERRELVFSSHEHPTDAQWAQTAAAELYAAILNQDACTHLGKPTTPYHELMKKYERYRPISKVKWSDIRSAILGINSDLLLILDCCAAGGANLDMEHSDATDTYHNTDPSTGKIYTKHLFAACGFESSTSDDMTSAMCDVLDEWPAGPDDAALQDLVTTGHGGGGGGGYTGKWLTTRKLHQIVESKLQRNAGMTAVGLRSASQPIFKQLLPVDLPERYITLPNLQGRQRSRNQSRGRNRHSHGQVAPSAVDADPTVGSTMNGGTEYGIDAEIPTHTHAHAHTHAHPGSATQVGLGTARSRSRFSARDLSLGRISSRAERDRESGLRERDGSVRDSGRERDRDRERDRERERDSREEEGWDVVSMREGLRERDGSVRESGSAREREMGRDRERERERERGRGREW